METIKNKIIITGASGFIGRHLLEDLDGTRHEITVITRDPSGKFPFLPAGTKVLIADLRDLDSLRKATAGADLIIHTAAEIRNTADLVDTNSRGTANLINAAMENGVRRIIHLSSVGVVGAQFSLEPRSIKESEHCKPVNLYEATKLESEQLMAAAAKNGIRVQVLRPTNVYGEYHGQSAMLAPMQHLLAGKYLPHTRDAVVNYLYVKDLTRLMVRLIDDEHPFGVVNVGEALPVREFYAVMEDLLGQKGRWITVPRFLVKFMESIGIRKLRPLTNAVAYDDSELKKVYKYDYGTREGLKRTITYYRSKGQLK